jgi:hypothetical protein
MNLPVDTESIVFADDQNVITPDIDVDSISFDDFKQDLSGGPNASISAAPPKQSVWQRVKESFSINPIEFGANVGQEFLPDMVEASPEESIAKAQNIYAISQTSGVPQQDIAEHYEELMKMSSVTGIDPDPTKYETLEKAMTLGLAPAMIAAPVPTAVGLLGFAALDAIFPTDAFIPEDASAESRDNIRLIAMLVKGGAVGGFIHAFPKAPKGFPSGARMAEYPLESAARVRDNAVGIFKAFTKQKLTEKGMPTEIVITPEQLAQIHEIQPVKVEVPQAVIEANAKRARKDALRSDRDAAETKLLIQRTDEAIHQELKARLLDGEVINKGYHPETLRDAKMAAVQHINDIQAKEGKVRNKFQQIRYDLNKQMADADKVTAHMGLDSVKVETAINNGMSVKVPVESLVDVAVKSEENFVRVQEILSQKTAKTASETAVGETSATKSSGGTASIEPIKLEPIQGTGESKTMGLSESVKQKAVENGIADIFQELPASEKLKIPEQAKLAIEYLKNDPKMVQRVAMGEIPSPDPKVTPEAFFVALVDKATREGDAFSLHALATSSKLIQESRTMGQRIRTLGELSPDSPVKAMRDVAKAREDSAQKATGKKSVVEAKQKVVKDIKKSIKENAPTIDEWASFLKELEC